MQSVDVSMLPVVTSIQEIAGVIVGLSGGGIVPLARLAQQPVKAVASQSSGNGVVVPKKRGRKPKVRSTVETSALVPLAAA